MSEALTPEAPGTDSAAPAVAAPAPEDGMAAAEGSAGEGETKYVEAARFNGLMSAHQKALNELEAKNQQLAELYHQPVKSQVLPSTLILRVRPPIGR